MVLGPGGFQWWDRDLSDDGRLACGGGSVAAIRPLGAPLSAGECIGGSRPRGPFRSAARPRVAVVSVSADHFRKCCRLHAAGRVDRPRAECAQRKEAVGEAERGVALSGGSFR